MVIHYICLASVRIHIIKLKDSQRTQFSISTLHFLRAEIQPHKTNEINCPYETHPWSTEHFSLKNKERDQTI